LATRQGIISVKMMDAVGVVASYDEYVTFDDATATFATIQSAVNSRLAALDVLSDAQILGVGFRWLMDIPGTLKSAPAGNSDVEETGLFTFITGAPGGKVWSSDVPAISYAIVTGRTIDVTTPAAAGTNYVTTLIATGGTLRNTDNKWAYTLDSVRGAQKTFRKHRKALKRA
jgi:hypothetical protein